MKSESTEPLYRAWLEMTGENHPIRDALIVAMETDWRGVDDVSIGPVLA